MHAFERARSLAHQRLERAHINDGYQPRAQDKTLVIIDMQNGFLEAGDPDCYDIIPNICRTIQHAMINGWGIIIVEYTNNGQTDNDILEAVSGYNRLQFVSKDAPDGGRAILSRLKANPGLSLDLLVCGIYGDMCVAQTVSGLLSGSSLVEVSIIDDIVYPEYCAYQGDNDDIVTMITLQELGIDVEVEV